MNNPKQFSNACTMSLSLAMLAAALTISGCSSAKSEATRADRTRVKSEGNVVLASPGRIEGRTEVIEVGAAADGVIRAVHVEEGQQVPRGHKLAEIECSDVSSGLQAAAAEKESSIQVKTRLLRGSREEERLSAIERTSAAKAVVQQAKAQYARVKELVDGGVAAKSQLDEAQRDFDVAEARLKEAISNEELVKAQALTEEVAKADADIQAAENRIHVMKAKLDKCAVSAPIAGTVLRIHMKAGESFSTMAPRPILTMADISARRVRAELDERDVSKVRLGQKVSVYADGNPDQKASGAVFHLAPTMGRKKTLAGDPAEKADRDVLEALIELDEKGMVFPIGLRVVVQFFP